MAFIYRYCLRNNNDRGTMDLTKHTQKIIDTLNKTFVKNLKDSRVLKDHFEFKLYKSAEHGKLSWMGKYLFEYFQSHRLENYGFVRMPQEFYAFLYHSEDAEGDFYYLELIDFADIEELINEDNRKTFNMRAEEYAQRFLTKNNRIITDRSGQNLINAFYLDVVGAYAKVDFFKDLLIVKNITLLKIEGWHIKKFPTKHYGDKSVVRFENELNTDVAYIREEENPNTDDYFFITNYEEITNAEEMIKRIDAALNLGTSLVDAEEIEVLGDIVDKKIRFTVYNVGQGLSTSLTYDGKEKPFLFFDFGAAEGRNSFTRPNGIKDDIDENATIILSHIHKDHWYRLVLNRNAFKSKWFLPSQKLNYIFNKKCSEIIMSGGSAPLLNQIKNKFSI